MKVNIFSSIVALILLLSCTKEEKGLDVTATGFVKLVNVSGGEQFDASGIAVSSSDNSSLATTNADGKYSFGNLLMGKSYDFIYKKEGYGQVKLFNCGFLSGAKPCLLPLVTLYKVPVCSYIPGKIESDSYSALINYSISEPSAFNVIIYVNDSANVSNDHYDKLTTFQKNDFRKSPLNYTTSLYFRDQKYSKGTTIYYVLYFNNFNDDGYFDYNQNTWIYSSAKKVSEVYSIKIP